MAHGYKTLQQWDKWLAQDPLGSHLLEVESQLLSCLLNKHFGKNVLLIGVPHQSSLLNTTPIPCHSLVTPLIAREKFPGFIEGDFHELPVLTGSIDLVLLPHALEFLDNPRQLLTEACRIIKPEGLITICGFNPYSLWGLQKLLHKPHEMPWKANSIQAHKIKNWLKLADFELEKHQTTFFRPTFGHKQWFKQLHFFETVIRKCFSPLGGIYILLARAKVIPLTPIRMKWKQHLSDIRISTTISGHIARQSK